MAHESTGQVQAPTVSVAAATRFQKHWLVILAGVLVSIMAFRLAWRAEQRGDEAEIDRQVAVYLGSLNQQRIGVEDVLRTLRALFFHNPGLSRGQFRDALSDLVIRTKGVQVFGWAPRVSLAGRDSFEARVRGEGFPDFQILEGDIIHPESDQPTRAADRPEYLPVEFGDAAAVNESVLGYDLLSVPALKEMLDRARDEQDVMASAPLEMPYAGKVVWGIMAAVPVYRPSLRPASVQERRAEFQGCVLAQIVFKAFMDSIAERVTQLDLDLILTANEPGAREPGKEVVLYARATRDGGRTLEDITLEQMRRSIHVERSLEIGGLNWKFFFRRGRNWSHWPQLYAPLVILLGGLFMTAMAARRLIRISRQTAVVEGLVHQRTNQLAEANSRLKAEIGERVEAENALSYERNLLRTLLDRLPDAVFLMNRAGCYIMLNDVHRRLLRLEQRDDALGRPVREVGPTRLAEALDEGRERVANTGETELSRDIPPLPGDPGPELFLNVSRLPLRQADGTVDRLVVLVRDVTSARKAEADRQEFDRHLQDTQKLESLGLIAGGVAHDFNNLLTVVNCNVSLARMDIPADSPIAPFLEQIDQTVVRAADLCRQMLAYAGKGQIVVRLFDLSRVAQETIDLIRLSVSKKAVVDLHLATGLPAISGDTTQIRQILLNLAINASEALGEGEGVIRISTSLLRADRKFLADAILSADLSEGEYVCLEVSDNGSGMAPETLRHIFDPFFTTKFLGRGLGLAAVLGIVRSHNGAVHVASELGKGTTFRLLLPRATGPAEAAASPASAEAPWQGEGTLLVVDDEAPVRAITAALLERKGFTVVFAVDGRDGADRFAATPDHFRGVLLDLTMPHLNGEEALQEIRRLRPKTPVLLMSGFSSHEAENQFAGLGLSGFLRKPFGAEQLWTAVRAMLERT
jgi:two-component system cell cycle sensor histidine kinase/response regulator CckA